MLCIAAVVFLAVCAYLGNGILTILETQTRTALAKYTSVEENAELTGIAIRREQLICSPDRPIWLAADGERIASGGELACFSDKTVLYSPCAALFFHETDGYESLTPEMFENPDVSFFEEALTARPSVDDSAIGRLVEEHSWYYAALANEGTRFPANGDCSIHFDGMQQPVPAKLISLSSAENGKIAVLFRINRSDLLHMSLRKAEALLIISQYSGIEIPKNAVKTDKDGNEFVFTLTAGNIERKAVELIYTTEKSFIAKASHSADSLREGDMIIISED